MKCDGVLGYTEGLRGCRRTAVSSGLQQDFLYLLLGNAVGERAANMAGGFVVPVQCGQHGRPGSGDAVRAVSRSFPSQKAFLYALAKSLRSQPMPAFVGRPTARSSHIGCYRAA